jgi:alkylated DNA nucleotide flippase Atl1
MSEVDLNREMAGIWMNLFRDVSRSAEQAASRVAAPLEGEIEDSAPVIRSRWGRKILRLDAPGIERGMTTKEISVAVGINDERYAEKVLAQLEKNGLVELVGHAAPKRWRLTREQRRNRILRVSRLVPRGNWTTYGDIAIAVGDNIRLARPVSRVAAKNPAFANPHRVLEKAGTIPKGWVDDEGRGPEECERRLAEEGVKLVDGKAPRSQRINHDELRTLLVASEASDDETAAA